MSKILLYIYHTNQLIRTGPAIPSLMNQTLSGGFTIWGTPILLKAQEASWISKEGRRIN